MTAGTALRALSPVAKQPGGIGIVRIDASGSELAGDNENLTKAAGCDRLRDQVKCNHKAQTCGINVERRDSLLNEP